MCQEFLKTVRNSRWRLSWDSNGFRKSYVCVNSSCFYVSRTHQQPEIRRNMNLCGNTTAGGYLSKESRLGIRSETATAPNFIYCRNNGRGSLLFCRYENVFSFSHWFSYKHVVTAYLTKKNKILWYSIIVILYHIIKNHNL